MSEILCRTFELSIATGAELQVGGASNVFRNIAMGQPEVSLSFTQDLTDGANQALYDHFINNTEVSIQITFTHAQEISSGTPYKMVIQLPRMIFQGEGFEASDGATIPETYTLKAFVPDTGAIASLIAMDVTDSTEGVIEV